MMKLNKAVAASVLTMALLVPGIAQAEEMMPMESKSSTMVEQNMMMNTKDLVPLRMFAETLGYKIMWNKEDRSVMLSFMEMDTDNNMGMQMDMNMDMSENSDQMGMNEMYTIKLMLDSKSIMVGMDTKMLEQAPMLMDGKVYVSKDFVKYLLAPYMM